MHKKLIAISLSCSVLATIFMYQNNPEQPAIDFFNTTFLRNSPAVQKVLKSIGFFEVDVTTHDNLSINAIMLDQTILKKQVQATIISCPGFVPGRKEGMTTLYAMLKEQPYNFIFIDSRGHGKSDGELLTFQGLKNYGVNQFFDIVAITEFIYDYNVKHGLEQNIIMHGLCSGAFHTIKAVGYLQIHNPKVYTAIKGIIFDSGWPAIAEIAETVVTAEAQSRCKKYHIPFFESCAAYILRSIYRLFFKAEHQQQRPITEIIGTIDQPILFIHAQDDTFVPVETIQPLLNQAQKPHTWLVKDSSHVNNHLKHKDMYQEKIDTFIKTIL
jgi:pimeloyl-ACP methyl ester carboxylesterase